MLPTAPLVPLAVAVAAGVALDRDVLAWETRQWASLALATAAAAFLVHRRQPTFAFVAVLLAWASLGGAWHHHSWNHLDPDDLARDPTDGPRIAWLRGVISDVPAFQPGTRRDDRGLTRTVLEVESICDGKSWRPASGSVQLLVPSDRTDLEAGSSVEAAGTLAPIAAPLNPGEFDYRHFMRAQGIRLRLSLKDPECLWSDDRDRSSTNVSQVFTRWIGRVRAWSNDHLIAHIDPRIAPLATALLLGRREGVDPETTDAFTRTCK
jgi:competence protein ComEC